MGFQIVQLANNPVQLNFTGGVTPKGAYVAETTYSTGESVSYQGSSYVAIQETTGNLPTNTTYWQVLANKGDTGATGAGGAKGDQGDPGTDGLTVSVNSVTQVGGNITLTQDDVGDGTTYKQYSATEKTKLAGIEANANNYSLPTAAAAVLGGVKVGTRLSIDGSGVLSADVQTTDISGKASLALDNLASVAINTSLISDTDSTDDLGSSSKYWANTYTDKLYLNGTAYLDGSTAANIDVQASYFNIYGKINGKINGAAASYGDLTNATVYFDLNGRGLIGLNATSGNVTLQGGSGKGVAFAVNNATFGSGVVATISTTGVFAVNSISSYGSNANLSLVPNGTGYTIIGDAGTTSHTFNTNDDLLVSGRLEVDGVAYLDSSLTVATGFGCNGKAAQTAYASGGAVTDTATSGGYGFTDAAHFNSMMTLLGNIRSALVANGIMS